MSFKPMLACNHDPQKLIFPLYASPKLDGLRGLVHEGKLLSRSLKPIPNKHVSKTLEKRELEGFDGELIVGPPTARNCYTNSTSHIMSHDKVMDFTFYVFDLHNVARGFEKRFDMLAERVEKLAHGSIVLLEQKLIRTEDALLEYEQQQLTLGYEGLILRSMDGKYKYGRSTTNEGYLLKVKRFEDSEAVIVGFEEQMHNGNEATVNELGRTKRSSHKENKTGKGTLGALIVKDVQSSLEFRIGTGLDDALRAEIWGTQSTYQGLVCKYKFFPVGVKELPRHPVWIGLRDRRDM